MKTACVMLLMLVGVAIAEKRFFLDQDQTSDYDAAKATFNQVAGDVDFDAAVQALIPYIHSDMTVIACTAVCVSSAASVLGPAALLSGVVCGPLCDGALAYLEEQAG